MPELLELSLNLTPTLEGKSHLVPAQNRDHDFFRG